MDRERLTGGVNNLERIGAVVHRPAGAWTPAVHGLLSWVREHGFTGAPTVHGFDDDGREMLGFIPGEVPPSDFRATVPALRATGALLRSFHDATVGFTSAGPWYWPPRAPAEVFCHGDIAPYNTVFRGRMPVAFIDFDTAQPGPRVWDVAYAAYRFVPLEPGFDPARLDAFLDGYGMGFPDLFSTAAERLEALVKHILSEAAAGHPAFARHVADGHVQIYQLAIEFLRTFDT